MRETSPQGNAAAGTSGASTFSPAIVVLLLVGLALRLIIAHVLLPGSGFPNDLASFRGWSDSLVAGTPMGFYDRPGFLDYPPVYLLALYLQGIVFSYLGGVGGDAIKVVPILADLALAWVVYVMAQEFGASRRRALIAAAVVILNPVTWFNSAIWGQADAVGSVFLLLGLRALLQDRRELASALAVVAALTKLQLGILGFLVGFVVLRRSLRPRSGEADPGRVLTSIAAGLGTAALLCLPFTGVDYLGLPGRLASASFGLTLLAALATGAGTFLWARRNMIVEGADRNLTALLLAVPVVAGMSGQVFDAIVERMANTFGEYPYLTLNAYNPWALAQDENGGSMAQNLGWVRDAPFVDELGRSFSGFNVGPFTAGTVALAVMVALLFAGLAAVAWQWARSLEAEGGSSDLGPEDRPDGWASDLRGVAGACLAAVGVVALALAGQISGPLPAAAFGEGLLLATIVGVAIWAAWRDDRLSILVALAILAIAFFVLPTRAHERYLFPFFAVGAILLALSWRWAAAYVLLAVVNSANLLAVLTQYCGIPSDQPYSCLGSVAPLGSGSQSVAGLLIDWGTFLREAKYGDYIWPIALSAVLTGLALLWALWQMRGRAVERLAAEAASAGGEPDRARPEAGWDTRAAEWGAPATGAAAARQQGPAPAAGSGAAEPGEEWQGDADYEYYEDERPYTDDDPEFVPQRILQAWRWLSRPSLRPDRSPALAAEPRGRLDKLDLWIVVALIAVVLSMRVYRLDEPPQTHFDEVYHARTATEFLQDWRYGMSHDIYEWTHPHLAKYGIAAGITLFSDYRVTATGDLGVPVEDVAIQPRTPPPTPATADQKQDPRYSPDARLGDRVFVATGNEVRVYDLQTRDLEWTYDVPNVTALSIAAQSGVMYAGTSDGLLWRIDMDSLDEYRLGRGDAPAAPVKLDVQTGLEIDALYAGAPPIILAIDASGDIVSVDGEGGITGRGKIAGVADFVRLGNSPPTAFMIPDEVTSPEAEASALADAVGLDETVVRAMLSSSATGQTPVPLDLGTLDEAMVATIQARILEGALPGIEVTTDSPQLLVAYAGGVALMDAERVTITTNIYSDAPATSIAVNTNSDQPSYAAAGDSIILLRLDQTNGSAMVDGSQPLSPMPGPVTKLAFDDATKILHALGRTPDGQGWTIYAVEINGNAVFADAVLPFDPAAIALDSSPQLPSFDRHEMLVFGADGSMATVDVGQFAFSWRIVGVLFGTLMAVCLYLLARLLFRRRGVALLAAFFAAFDGMLFVQSRIAMNDTYVGGLLLLAYVIFAALWLNGDRGDRRSWVAFWLGMPFLGLTLGLALAAKWVAMYALASIGLLILVRSALGRAIAIMALAAGTGILGWMAIAGMHYAGGKGDLGGTVLMLFLALAVAVGGAYLTARRARTRPDRWLFGILTGLVTAAALAVSLFVYPPADQNGSPNYTFFLIMLVATMVAAAAAAYRPIAWTRQEMWFAVGVGLAAGVSLLAVGFLRGQDVPMRLGLAGLAVGPAFWLAGRAGFGPLAAPPPDDPSSYAEPPAPAPAGWLRLGSGFGLPAAWMAACLLALPLAVYVASYVPWAMPWQEQTAETGSLPILYCFETDELGQCVNAFPAGHTGQTLMDLTVGMYNYHNDLRATHAASSPWWAWPLDLKPVWFHSDHYALSQGSMIYDGGNPVTWWLAIFAMGFVCWQAFKRRSLGLMLIAVAFFWQWLAWARIDRAAFQYHFYTALPFFLMGLAYFIAELWHGPSRRTWLFARVAAAAMILLPALLWLGKGPLCGLARVDTSSYWGQTACMATAGNFVVEQRMFLIAVVLLASLAVLTLVLSRLEREAELDEEGEGGLMWAVWLLLPVVIAGVLLIAIGQYGSRDTLFEVPVSAGGGLITVLVPLLALAVLGIVAVMVLVARDPRRFAAAYCAAAAFAFVVLYPNLSALLMPDNLVSVYNGFLPTWLYGFQFSVNMQPAVSVPPTSSNGLLLAGFVLLMALVVGYAAWTRRVVEGYRRHLLVVEGLEGDPEGEGSEQL
jgi:Gpi18-like mannosyltransferase